MVLKTDDVTIAQERMLQSCVTVTVLCNGRKFGTGHDGKWVKVHGRTVQNCIDQGTLKQVSKDGVMTVYRVSAKLKNPDGNPFAGDSSERLV